MIIVYNLENFKKFKHSAIALGNFDGVHLAHQEVIKNCVNYARNNSIKPAVLTFYPHPKAIINTNQPHKYLINLKYRIKRFADLGVEIVFLIKFNQNFADISPKDFIKEILNDLLEPKYLVTGYNFTFGKKRKGDIKLLYSYSRNKFKYQVVNKIDYRYQIVSSSVIKNMLNTGLVASVSKILGYHYFIEGLLTYNSEETQVLKLSDFTVMNVNISEKVYLPLYGAYCISILLGESYYYGIADVGEHTFNQRILTLKIYLFNYNRCIYNQYVKINFLFFLRPERKFIDINLLKFQILRDREVVKYILLNLNINN